MAYQVNKAEMLRYLGYTGQNVDGALDGRIDELCRLCETESAPGFLFRLFPVQETSDGVRLKGTSLLLTGENICEHLHGARMCAVMACTLGLANESALHRLQAKSPTDAALFSAAGSSLVECVADACEAAVAEQAARQGLRTNWRFSPGYGDLPLALQTKIVRVLQADTKLGMTPTDSHMLIPAKSVTAFIGLFDKTYIPESIKLGCAGCACSDHCSLRAAGSPCHA